MVPDARVANPSLSARAAARIERSSVWREYLRDTHRHQGPSYEEVEPWAWKRLRAKLDAIDARERRQAAA